jgi:hypothetical protein
MFFNAIQVKLIAGKSFGCGFCKDIKKHKQSLMNMNWEEAAVSITFNRRNRRSPEHRISSIVKSMN